MTNLTVCVPGESCNKNCPYCVSKMTWAPKPDFDVENWPWDKIRKKADLMGVDRVLVTGKGEPIMPEWEKMKALMIIVKELEHYQLEIQTNGVHIRHMVASRDQSWPIWAGLLGQFNVLAISIDDPGVFKPANSAWELARLFFQRVRNALPKIIFRITINATNEFKGVSARQILNFCKINDIRQVTFRHLSIPEGCEGTKQAAWIIDNTRSFIYNTSEYEEGKDYPCRTFVGRMLNNQTAPDTSAIFDVEGIAVLHSFYCVQDCYEDGKLRSLIVNQDGHVYTSWNSPASILF